MTDMENGRKEKKMTGKEIRKERFFSNGNPVVVAIDHGQYFGPIPGLIDVKPTVSKLSQADGILMTPFVVSHVKETFFRKDGPSLIVRLNWTTALCIPWKYKEAHTKLIVEPDEALSLGADIVLANLTLQSGSEKVDAKNVKVFAEIAKRKEKAGIPLIGEIIPMTPLSNKKKLHKQVKDAVRIAWELGADMIKTYYTGETFEEVVEGVPIPVFVLGGEKMKTEKDALKLAEKAISSGAKGVVFGRNVFQSKDPEQFIQKLKKVVRRK